MEDLTFSTQLLKIKAKLKFWKPVKLSLIGKIKVFNIYICSRLWYRTEFYDTYIYISELNRETTDFIWRNKKHDLNQNILMTNTGNGGLGLTNISLTLFAPGFFGWCRTRGGGLFSTPSITPLSLKLDYSNFVQNYFGIR